MGRRPLFKVLVALQTLAFFVFLLNYGVNRAPKTVNFNGQQSGNTSISREISQSTHSPVSTKLPAIRESTKLLPTNGSAKLLPTRGPTKLPAIRGFTKLLPTRGPTELPAIRGPLSNCTKADIMKRPGVMLLVTTNLGFLDMTLNMLKSIKRIGVCVNTTVIAEDEAVYQYLHKRAGSDPGVHVVSTDSGEMPKNIRRYTQQYFKFFSKRQPYMLSFLKQGMDVLFSDSDTFWFRDPFPFFKGDFDMSMIDPRSPYPNRTANANFCAGFVYLKPTVNTIKFIETWIEVMDNLSRAGRIKADQGIMNGLLREDKPVHVNIKPLDTNIFPWGPKFYKLLAQKANYTTVVMHAASIRGHDGKIDKFKSSNMWLVNATNEELVGALPK